MLLVVDVTHVGLKLLRYEVLLNVHQAPSNGVVVLFKPAQNYLLFLIVVQLLNESMVYLKLLIQLFNFALHLVVAFEVYRKFMRLGIGPHDF